MAERRKYLHSSERVAALLAAAVALALNVAASAELFVPQTTFGYRLVYTNGFEVAAVDPGTAAARAGILAGDRLDFTKSTLHDRLVGLSYLSARRGETVRFFVVRNGISRAGTLKAGPLTASESQEALFSPLSSFLRLTGFAYIVVALIILLRRPNRMTWGLFLYLVSASMPVTETLYRFSDRLLPIAAFASDLLSVAGTVGLVIFAVRFPEDRPFGWRAWIDRFAVPIGALFAIPNLAWDVSSIFAGESPTAWMAYGSTLGALALILVAGATLVATYIATSRWQRQRLQWVIAGVFFTLLSEASAWARYWSSAYPLASADALVWAATILYACAPFAIAYAVVRQRVFEISFVVSRTLVYSIVTATIFCIFALVEWLAGRIIEHSGATIALVALVAVGVAYSLHAIYARAEHFVEGTLFRRRHQAEQHLAAVATGLPCAENAASIEAALVGEPIQTYTLSSAHLFVRNADGNYVSESGELDRCIVLQLQGVRRSIHLHEGAMVLAVPVFVGSRLEAIAVYGAHVNGEDIDPDEAAALQALGLAAGVAYDHLATMHVERELTRWRKLAQRQARELAGLRAGSGTP